MDHCFLPTHGPLADGEFRRVWPARRRSKVHSFSCLDQILSMAFRSTQLRESLRDIAGRFAA